MQTTRRFGLDAAVDLYDRMGPATELLVMGYVLGEERLEKTAAQGENSPFFVKSYCIC